MFSATLHSDEVKDIAKRICHQPILIDLKVGTSRSLPPTAPTLQKSSLSWLHSPL